MDEAVLRLVVESAPSALIMVDESGAITLANPQAEHLFGYDRDGLLGKSIDMLVPERFRARHPDQRGGFFARPSKRAMGAGRDLYGLRRDGVEVPVEIGLTPIQTPQGPRVLAALIDISERKRLEQQRVESEMRYSELVEQAADAILVRRADGEVVFVNEAACLMLGYSRAEFMEISMMDLLDPGDRESLEMVQGLRPLETRHFERRLRHKGGHWVPVETSAHRLGNGDIQNIFHDISERLRARDALRVLPKQLLDAQEAERRRIARELHDEVGQTLVASQMKLRKLEASLQGREESSEAAQVSRLVATLLQQVRQLSLDLRPAVLDNLGLAAAIQWFVRERVPQGHVEIELDVPLALRRPPVSVETAMFRVFQSAITNVLRHAEARTLRVSLRPEPMRLILEVRDDGKGFDIVAARQRALQGGSLGLLGIEDWVRLSGGEVTIESEPGRGTTVRASVPLPADTGAPSTPREG